MLARRGHRKGVEEGVSSSSPNPSSSSLIRVAACKPTRWHGLNRQGLSSSLIPTASSFIPPFPICCPSAFLSVCPLIPLSFNRITESWNNLEGTLKSPSPTPCNAQGHVQPDRVAFLETYIILYSFHIFTNGKFCFPINNLT